MTHERGSAAHTAPVASARAHLRACVAAAIAGVVLLVGCAGDGGGVADGVRLSPLATEGRWFVDAEGRVVQLRGVNEVYKSPPYYPAADGFGRDDARFLARHGFNTVRLGVTFGALMPEPGRIDSSYIDGLATSVADITEEGMYVLFDFHQDGYAPKYNGNGFPDWMAIDDGLENPRDAVFPLYYIQNPAMQRAWESFWANRPGPGGAGLQDRFIAGLTAVVERFSDEPGVLGYEAINEPFPGADWGACITAEGCAEVEQERLAPFARRVEAAVREVTPSQGIWVEPFVLFNFGQGPTSLTGTGGDALLAVHSYALDAAGEAGVVDNAVAAAERDDKPVLVTEFGASAEPALLDRLADGLDRGMLPWLFWAYNENIMSGRSSDASLQLVNDPDAFRALVRPYPKALAGVPRSFSYDADTRTFDLRYVTTRADGKRDTGEMESVIFVPALIYGDGYEADVAGGRVTSGPCAQDVTIVNDRDVAEVTVRVTPATDTERDCAGDGE